MTKLTTPSEYMEILFQNEEAPNLPEAEQRLFARAKDLEKALQANQKKLRMLDHETQKVQTNSVSLQGQGHLLAELLFEAAADRAEESPGAEVTALADYGIPDQKPQPPDEQKSTS